jgi:hypothetical protein
MQGSLNNILNTSAESKNGCFLYIFAKPVAMCPRHGGWAGIEALSISAVTKPLTCPKEETGGGRKQLGSALKHHVL